MDGIRFILEDPKSSNSRQKKRSRLVTACDTCRTKKIKCHQSPNSSKCEACRLSKTPCRFRDRERYHAERAGSLSASSSNLPSDSEDSQSCTDSPSALSRRATLPAFPHYATQAHLRSSSLPPAMPHLHPALAEGAVLRADSPSTHSEVGPHRVRRGSSRRHGGPVDHLRQSPSLHGMSPLSGMQGLHIDEHYRRDIAQHFDSLRPGFPLYKTGEHAIDLFFENLGSQFLFLHHDAVRRAWMEQTMSATFANCLAALGMRFSHSEMGVSPIHLGDPFLDMAKDLIVPAMYSPSVENVHSLLLLAWAEYGSGRENGLRLYSTLAVQMATELGLGSEDAVRTVPLEVDRNDIRQTWWHVVLLDTISSWITGNPACADIRNSTTLLPTSSFLASDPSSSPILPFTTLHELLVLRDGLLRVTNFNFDITVQSEQDRELMDIRARLLDIKGTLPKHLEFNGSNMRLAFQDRQEPVYIYLHLILNSLIALSHCPAIFRGFSSQMHVIPEITTTATRAIFDVLVTLEQVDPRAVSVSPFLDIPFAVASRSFTLESRLNEEMTPCQEKMPSISRARYAEVSIGVCNTVLSRIAENWGNVRNIEMAIQSGTLWSTVCSIQQSPVALPSSLGIPAVDNSQMEVPRLYFDASDEPQELGLTYSDSDVSREPSPLIFEFPGFVHKGHHHALQRSMTEPASSSMLTSSFTPGESPLYDDLSKYMGHYSDDNRHPLRHDADHFAIMPSVECSPSAPGLVDDHAHHVSPYPQHSWVFT